ncbi:phosphate--nucleotide phosphotransferase [Siphonobacter sp. BAB-5405]|uniref:polyphosphate kinase 2 family protein n=1 Tax=Siphonobacter sp. BAB-5405 TaxID=1864825 RepID=UPI000C800E94|nr:polyphosphate kinase 2 family protein [Siphonobacter sp. BAB-5405]PMD94365.1 phosphate--nucleotide phosphotransferase [Siphonobacter sp. BAB-5405]
MNVSLNSDDFRFTGKGSFKIKEAATKIKDLYQNKDEYEELLTQYRQEIDDLQSLMYAHNRFGLLLIFQAMDAAGKDGTIGHVITGVNPFGVNIHNFKKPSSLELEHDFMWRTSLRLPQRGTIGIFNRSYYEEVLVTKVHPEIITNTQLLPHELTEDMDKLFKHRYKDIKAFEKYLRHNGIEVMKFFLNVSKEEQASRLISRIEDASKNWKFEESDVNERDYWDDYMQAYEETINQTSTKKSPWYIIPADDKKNMRLIVSQLILEKLSSLFMHYPESSEERQKELKKLIDRINDQTKA